MPRRSHLTHPAHAAALTRREALVVGAATAAAAAAALGAPEGEAEAAADAGAAAGVAAPASSALDRVLIERGCQHAAQGWRPGGGWSGGDDLDG